MKIAKLSVAVATACLLAAGGCAQQGGSDSMAAGDAMTGDELRTLLSNGRTLVLGGMGEDYAGEVKLASDGTGQGQATTNSGRVINISGTWEIDGDQFCRRWTLDAPARVCETWRKLGDNKVAVMVNGKRIGVNSW